MSARLHASGTVCKASVRACPLGDSEHFTPEEFAVRQMEEDLAAMEGSDYSWTSESMDEQAAYLEEQDELERRLAEHDAYELESTGRLPADVMALLHRNGISEGEVTAVSDCS